MSESDVRWCCLAFEGWHAEAGRRGVSVLARPGEMQRRSVFILQHRAVDEGMEERVQADVLVDLISDIEIQFCPWCGVRLRDWYSEDTVARLHRSASSRD